jgi:tetraacyldisaccharide 4'-kinase
MITPILIIVSIIYGLIIKIRNTLYDLNYFKSHTFHKPIISIGNITAGGTGKTPLVIYIARIILNQGRKPGIISRGYGRKSKGMIIVHDGNKMLVDVNKAGDEPFLIGEKLKNVPIIVSNNRYEGITALIKNYFVDIIIMDDGFQHRSIKRDLNIITISGKESLKNYKLLPWGKMRESLSNIKRSNLIVYTKTNQKPMIHQTIKKLCSINYIISNYKLKLYHYNLNQFNQNIGEPVFAFCGIADHNSFFKSIIKLGITIKGKKYYKDHQNYSDRIIKNLFKKIKKLKLNNIITTEKDIVKLPQYFINAFQIYIIKISIIVKDESKINTEIKKLFSENL